MTADIIRLPVAESTSETLRADFLAGLTPSTAKVYRRHLGRLSVFLDHRPLESITRRELEAWCRSLQAEGLSGSTVKLALASVRSFLTFAMYEGVVDRNVAKAVRLHIENKESPRRPLSPEQIRMMFLACGDDLRGLRDRAMLALGAVQALRVSEIKEVCIEDFGEQGGHRTLDVRGKGRKHCTVPVAAQTYEAMMAWATAAGITSGPVMIGIDRSGKIHHGTAMCTQTLHVRVAALGKRAGIERAVFPHLLRHSAVTTFLDHGGSLRHASSLARHANISTTQIYDGHRRSLNNPAVHVLGSAFVPDTDG
ncbi:MAG: tyrosine-type recombinase/integrase [Rhodobacterales bacterium]|nr:tyrosine-type recombinase/integrase [Rhodobacterales bacterium]